ncbi:AraC family transcriptional regulator [Sphingobacteriales bacterium UPWRP_1]|nr:GyrI-like domain-containing protein [Sphingobacteriales bacterium TSM_CSS]PSJ77279.1 AraC family transcriptional regulator [Sphingobacteriales bacterium UPWRP_1]
MKPQIQNLQEKKLVGMQLLMSLTDNKTGELWRRFMPKRREIINTLNNNLISLQIYEASYFSDFNPAKTFVKWATVEVADFDHIPANMERFILPGGLYAVFHYKGPSDNSGVFQYIFGTWLPNSGYILDNRPHFEVLGAKYSNNNPSSEEEIWIPVKMK